MKISRRDVRAKAMQVLYAYEISQEPVEMLFESIIGEELGKHSEYRDFAQSLVYKTLRYKDEADLAIQKNAKHWDMNRLATIDLILMRMAVVEFLYFEEIPSKVTINEYMEIGRQYSTDHSAPFINGMLDAVYSMLQSEDRITKTGRGLVQ